ncbi:unnamed protein product [Plutella xylostella]|uniref:(diamondback moth) hypothetical protein n=1 Tax=Plutella xylostella TaxID=51655 RepID=A0A8S4FWC3_PLUXY|nr:unnamed protein product [Plutella xylostella]
MGPSDTDRFREFVQKLQQEDERVAALNDIKNLLTYKPAGESAQVIRNVGITKILQCVNLPEKSQVDLTCEVLRLCFEKLAAGDAVKNYTSHIMYLA